jgi:erythromycin esterase
LNHIKTLAVVAVALVTGCDSDPVANTQSPLGQASYVPVSLQIDSLSGAELEYFSDLIGRARIVALGESRHDTSEQFALRALLTRNLVEDLGFRVIILEESFSHALALDAYVATGEGDVRSILNGLAGWYLWDTEEMVSFIEWVRGFNETVAADDRIRIFGMDITAPALGIRRAARRAHSLDSSSGWTSREYGLDSYLAGDFWPGILERYAGMQADDEAMIRRNLEELVDFLDTETHKPASGFDVRLAAIEAAIGKHAHDMFSSEGIAQIGAVRERGMADVVDWLVSENGVTASTVVWTHNLHAAKTEFQMPDMVEGPLTPLGVFLRQSYGVYYVAIGGTFGTGEYAGEHPPGERRFEWPDAETVDGAMARLGPPALILDLASLDDSSSASQWLSAERTWRMQDSVAILSARKGFDALYYVEEVSRAELTPLALQRHRGGAD